MPSEIAALLDPMAVAVRSIDMVQTECGTLTEVLNTSAKVLVIGAGAIGTMVALVLKIMGVEQAILTSRSKTKLAAASKIAGVDEAIAVGELDPDERVKLITNRKDGGADLVIQCAKDSAASVEGLQMMRKLGTYLNSAGYVKI
jgi:threonine dehydrogenase-like Zn-dependent dehydrogenase